VTHLLPSGESHTRAAAVRQWLTGTFTGRALVVGVGLKLVAWLGALSGWRPGLFGVADTLGGLVLLVAAVVLGYRLYAVTRHRLLWRVRRKLILSYIFIGVVPVLLVVVFFALGGLLFFFNVSSFMLRSHVDSLVQAAQFLSQAAAPALEQASTSSALPAALARRQGAAVSRYPLISYAVVPSRRCGDGTALTATVVAGPWAHLEAPRSIPEWVPCSGFASLIVYEAEGRARVAARAVVWPQGLQGALVVDIPFGDELVREFHDEIGITIEDYSTADRSTKVRTAAADAGRPRVTLGPVNIRIVSSRNRSA
jgi:hypothetical protein